MSGSNYPLKIAQIKAERKMYKHSLNELIKYAQSLGVNVIIPKYILDKRLLITSWEADGRYDVHIKKLQSRQEEIWEAVRGILERLGNIA